MKVFPLSDYYYINDVVKHIDYKDVILNDISMMSIEQSKSDFESDTCEQSKVWCYVTVNVLQNLFPVGETKNKTWSCLSNTEL